MAEAGGAWGCAAWPKPWVVTIAVEAGWGADGLACLVLLLHRLDAAVAFGEACLVTCSCSDASSPSRLRLALQGRCLLGS